MFLYQPELDLDPAKHFGKCSIFRMSFTVSLVIKEHDRFPQCYRPVFVRDKKGLLSHVVQGIYLTKLFESLHNTAMIFTLIFLVICDITQRNGTKLPQGMFRLDIGKISLPRGWANTGTGFLVVVNAPHLSVVSRQWDNAFTNMLELLVIPKVVRQLDSRISVRSLSTELFDKSVSVSLHPCDYRWPVGSHCCGWHPAMRGALPNICSSQSLFLELSGYQMSSLILPSILLSLFLQN